MDQLNDDVRREQLANTTEQCVCDLKMVMRCGPHLRSKSMWGHDLSRTTSIDRMIVLKHVGSCFQQHSHTSRIKRSSIPHISYHHLRLYVISKSMYLLLVHCFCVQSLDSKPTTNLQKIQGRLPNCLRRMDQNPIFSVRLQHPSYQVPLAS